MAPPAAAAAPPAAHFSGTAAAAGAAAKAAGAAAAAASEGEGGDASSASLQRRLRRLTAQLLVLDYREPVGGGVEGVPLVERLLGDLVATSEAYERLQGREEHVAQDLALAQVIEGLVEEGCASGGVASPPLHPSSHHLTTPIHTPDRRSSSPSARPWRG